MEQDTTSGRAPGAVRWLARAEVAVVGGILIISLLITLYAIVARNLGHSTGDWALKLPELMLVWMTFLGMGALVTEHGHVAADMFLMRFSPRWQRIALTCSALITTAVLAIILAGAVSIVRTQIEIGATDEELFEIPTAIVLAGLPLGLAITIAHLLAEIYTIWRPSSTRPS
jgi:TRAP-type C4-dicarboxylate transport system permease small subunit